MGSLLLRLRLAHAAGPMTVWVMAQRVVAWVYTVSFGSDCTEIGCRARNTTRRSMKPDRGYASFASKHPIGTFDRNKLCIPRMCRSVCITQP